MTDETWPTAISLRDRMLRGETFPWEEVLSWIGTGDAELMGAAFNVLTGEDGAFVTGQVEPELVREFLARFLLLALAGNSESAKVFVLSPYSAGHELARLYKGWRRQASDQTSELLGHVRDELARQCRGNDERQIRRVVDGVLEHIFEDPTSRSDFDAWRGDRKLTEALEQAAAWKDRQEF